MQKRSQRLGGDKDFLMARACYAEGKQFTFTVTMNMVRSSPSWPKNADFPPLPPLKAKDLADSLLPQLVKNKEHWTLHSINLWPTMLDDKWFYFVVYDFRPPIPMTGPPIEMTIPVMMNGHVVKPTIRRYLL